MNSSARIACLVLALHLAGYDRLVAQRYVTTFGPLTEIAANRSAQGLISGDFNGDGLADLAAYGGSALVLYYQVLPPGSWQTMSMNVGRPIRFAVSARCNDDRMDDIVVATDQPGEIQVFLGRSRKRMSLAWRRTNAEPIGNLVAANINNDRKTDLLAYGEKQLGVQVLLGNGNGTFRPSPTLFGEYSFSALAVDDMNDDGIADVLAANWISNELLLYTGFGRLKFADPAVIALEYEPAFIATAYFDADPVKDIIALSTARSSCQVLLGDGLGTFTPSPPILLGAPPSGVSIADVNGDGAQDIGILSGEGRFLAVALNDGGGAIQELIKFSGGRSPSSFTFLAHGKSRLTDAAVLDSASHRIRIAVNAGLAEPLLQEQYLTGLEPSGIAAASLRRNRADDLFVANASGSTVSYFRNQADGNYAGQMSFSTMTTPSDLAFVWGNDSTAVLLVSDSRKKTSSVVEIHTEDLSHRSYALPLRESSTILSIEAEPRSGSLRIHTLEQEERRSRGASIVEFEQIAPSRFIERTCTPLVPMPFTACLMTRRSQFGPKDLCFVRYNPKTKAEDVYQMSQEKPRQFSPPMFAFAVSAGESTAVVAWSGDLNADGVDDLVLNIQEPVNLLLCSLGRRDSTFSPPLVRVKDVLVRSASDLRLADANGDRIVDILFENSVTKSLYYLPGTGAGTFLPKVRLISTEGIGAFTLGRRKRDGAHQLMVTDRLQGVMRIIPYGGEGE